MADKSEGHTLAPTYSNYFSILVTSEIVRISFGEAFGTPESAVFHTAVGLSPANARILSETLTKLMQAEQPSEAS